MLKPPVIRPLATADDAHWCAALMASTEPWLTLGRSYTQIRALVEAPDREVHIAIRGGRGDGERRLGCVVLVLHGAFIGYLQAIVVADNCRGQGIGSALLDFTESRIAQVSPNVFLCVSSFNTDARRLYERRNYELVGTLTNYIVTGHDELLMRKTIGPWSEFRPASG
jgi:[ribosomal protein S18]-alanine N-acetyltransferase